MHMGVKTALDLVDRRCQPAEVTFWEEHISTCTSCTQDLAEWKTLKRSLKRSHLNNAPARDLDKAYKVFTSADETRPTLKQVLAAVVFDSFQQPAFAGARGGAGAARQLIFRADNFDIHIKIWGEQDRRQLLGQMLSRSADVSPEEGHIHLFFQGERLESKSMDDMGEFHFTGIPEGNLSLQIDLPHLTVIGALEQRASDGL
jgi:hypothetical protein